MNALALTFEDHHVRIVMIDGEPWWVLADVCDVLGNELPHRVAERLDSDEKDSHTMTTPGGPQQMTVISEPGLYKLLATSRKPEARRFDRWVRHDVLPEIRRTGSYHGRMPVTLESIGTLFDQKLEPVHRGMAEMRSEIADVRGNVVFLTKRVDDMAPRHDFSKNTRRQWVYVDWKFYGGYCPCCPRRETKIVDEFGEIKDKQGRSIAHADHMNGRERTKPEDGWLVCKACNWKLEHDAQFKERSKPHHRVFEDHRREEFGTHSSQSYRRRKCSKLVKQSRQHAFVF
jgi:hypothetical protein